MAIVVPELLKEPRAGLVQEGMGHAASTKGLADQGTLSRLGSELIVHVWHQSG